MKQIDSLFITLEPKDETFHQYVVIAQSETGDDIFKSTGFDTDEDCWEYARMIAKANGLSDDRIDTDLIGSFPPIETKQQLIDVVRNVCIDFHNSLINLDEAVNTIFLYVDKHYGKAE